MDTTRPGYIEPLDGSPTFFATVHSQVPGRKLVGNEFVEDGTTIYLFTKDDGTEGRAVGHCVTIFNAAGTDIDWKWQPPVLPPAPATSEEFFFMGGTGNF